MDPELVLPLVYALGEDVEEVRVVAESGLRDAALSPDPETSAATELALVEALGDDDWMTRVAAEGILADIGASMIPLENGGGLIYLGQRTFWAPRTTVESVSERQPVPYSTLPAPAPPVICVRMWEMFIQGKGG